MMRRLVICIVILFSSLQLLAIDGVASHAVFYVPDAAHGKPSSQNMEFYWQVNQKSLRYVTNAEKMILAHIKTDIVVTGDNGVIKEEHFVFETTPRANVEELKKHSILNMRRYAIPTGNIKIQMTLTDVADTLHHYTYSDSFHVMPAPANAFYSEVQLLDTTLESGAETVYKKNGRQQVPSSANFVDDSRSQLHYYAELYNTNIITKKDYPLTQKVFIYKKEGESLSDIFSKTDTIIAQSMIPVSGTFDIRKLTSGNYYLAVRLENNAHFPITTQTLFFQRLNTHPLADDTAVVRKRNVAIDTGIEKINVVDLNKTFLADFSLGELKAVLKMMLPICDPTSVQTIHGFIKKPDDMYMRYFIYNYFANINKKDPSAAWHEFTKKVAVVNKKFTDHGVRGYETDRGIIYLRYGAPTDVITVENEQGTLPYEIWQYNNLTEMNRREATNALFLFYRSNTTLSDFKLLHSTVAGEVQNMQWRDVLYPSGVTNAGNINSRAEQYMGTR